MKKIIVFLLLISILSFSGSVKTGAYYDPEKEDIGVYYILAEKSKSNTESLKIIYAGGSNTGECIFYDINNAGNGVLSGTCSHKAVDTEPFMGGEVFKFEFLNNGDLRINDDYIYKRGTMNDKNVAKQIELFSNLD
ncbi:hypothetical protein [Sebaldella sp. S0638]|uniref:hypothetical protein n=1 Tax=Sebaldella sp. S0638 TaxID=2957809 RepID=UPI0020A134CD|nr:hypothetical protein [Sebaldella sp. S0638]MCP1226594.1 hypothetical protein [Sebaldella sp. S0638]